MHCSMRTDHHRSGRNRRALEAPLAGNRGLAGTPTGPEMFQNGDSVARSISESMSAVVTFRNPG